MRRRNCVILKIGWRLQREHPVPEKGLTKVGIPKIIARLHEELAVYEGPRK
jgi:hypothetical protein